MTENGKQILDSRIQVIFACAIDYSSWSDETEEQDWIAGVGKRFSIDVKVVEKIRAWWFMENNEFLNDLKEAMVQFSGSEGYDSEEIETIEAQFGGDMFCADLIVLLDTHLFGEPLSDDDVKFSQQIEVNDVDPDDLNPHFAKFLKSSVPVEVVTKYFASPAGSKVLESV